MGGITAKSLQPCKGLTQGNGLKILMIDVEGEKKGQVNGLSVIDMGDMLKEEVLAAVKDGKFHIWSAKTIDEGIEILTGAAAGTKTDCGTFQDGTVNQLVDKRLTELAQTLVKFGKDEEEKAKEK